MVASPSPPAQTRVPTRTAVAAEVGRLRGEVREKELLVASAEPPIGEQTRAGAAEQVADLEALRQQLADQEALFMALKVGSPRRLRVGGAYVDNPSAPITGAGAVPTVSPALSGPKVSSSPKPPPPPAVAVVPTVTERAAAAATTEPSPMRQRRQQQPSTAPTIFEREAERVKLRTERLDAQRQAALDVRLAEATFSPRINSRRLKLAPPPPAPAALEDGGALANAAVGANEAGAGVNNRPGSAVRPQRAQAAAENRFVAAKGYWPPSEEELMKFMSLPLPEPEPEPEPEPQPASAEQTEQESPALVEPLPIRMRVPLDVYAQHKGSRVARGLAIQAGHRSRPRYGRLSPPMLPPSVDDARAQSPLTLAREAAAAAQTGRISAPCLDTPLASPVRTRPRSKPARNLLTTSRRVATGVLLTDCS